MTDVGLGGLRKIVNARAPDRAEPSRRAEDRHDAKPPTIDEVYRRHAAFVWRLVRRFGVPENMAEDVMHEVFVVVQRRLPEYDGRATMSTWLYHLVRGVTSNSLRGSARAKRRLRLLQSEPSPPRVSTDPEEHARRQQAAAFVRAFLPTLDPDKRTVFELVEIDGLPVPEVAEICDIKLNTAYSRLRAARRRFRQAIDALRRGRSPQSEAG